MGFAYLWRNPFFIMRYTFLFLCLCLFVGCRQNPVTPQTGSSNSKSVANRFDDIRYPFRATNKKVKQISAHRGGGDLVGYPENCLESMKYIAEQTGAWMEIDIRESKDGHLILMHDGSLDRTTNGSGKVERKTLKELKQLKLKDNSGQLTDFRIPTLEEVLIWNETEGRTVLTLDIKQGVDYDDVLALVTKTNQMDNVVAIVYALNQAEAMRRKNDDIVISLPVRNMEEWNRLEKSKLKKDKLIAFTGTIRSSEKLYETLHDNGILAIFGTMGNIDRQAAARGKKIYSDLYEAGANILSTDRPLDVL